MHALALAVGLHEFGGAALDFLGVEHGFGRVDKGVAQKFGRMRGGVANFPCAALGVFGAGEIFFAPSDAIDFDLDDHPTALAHKRRGLAEGDLNGFSMKGCLVVVEQDAHRVALSAAGLKCRADAIGRNRKAIE